MKQFLIALVVLVSTSFGIADDTSVLQGTFSLNIAGPKHPIPLNGTIELSFNKGQIQLAKAATVLPVMGKTAFESKEQYYNTLVRAGVPTQASVIFQLKLVPHKWYFVIVADAQADGKTYAGNMYKVLATPDQIKTVLAAGVNNAAAPADWKTLGSASLNMN